MITNYIKSALRNFYRNKSITIIKILGLSLGLTVTFFILIYVSTETSYNDFVPGTSNVFRVNQIYNLHGWGTTQTNYPLKEELVSTYPEIERATRVIYLNQFQVRKDESLISENGLISVDKEFFSVWDLSLLNGSITSFNNDPNQVVITESYAKKYFTSVDVVGKEIEILISNQNIKLNVSAVIKDIPKTSTIKAQFIVPIEFGLNQSPGLLTWSDGSVKEKEFYQTSWETDWLETYVVFNGNEIVNESLFKIKLKDLEAKHLKDTTERDYYIQNVGSIYLDSKDLKNQEHKGDMDSVIIFSIIAFLVLLVACINYIILSISQIISRTKEIGIRKITGAKQWDLFRQISVESFLVVVITLPVAFIAIEQLRPLLSHMIGKQILLIYNSKFILGFVAIILFVVFVPGINIVYFLNKISPISILRKDIKKSTQGFSFRKILIALQFMIFISLVVFAVGIKRQLIFSSQTNLGFEIENRIVLYVSDLVRNGNYDLLKTELLKNPKVKNVSGAMWLPPSNGRMSVSFKDPENSNNNFNMEALFVDKDFVETMGIEILEGESFSFVNDSDNGKVLINEQAKEYFEIGEQIWGNDIIGVVKDFKFHSFHEKVGPMFLIIGNYMIRDVVIDYAVNIEKSDLIKIKDQLLKLFPDSDIEPILLNEHLSELYSKEKRLVYLISMFSTVAIFIASIGLLGLTIFTTKKQGKSIAIRKVNGASNLTIWRLLISDYINLIVIALFISVPISYYFLNKWLQNFAYHVNVEWWIFVLAGILAIFIALLTISWYSLKAARSNPVESLRYE